MGSLQDLRRHRRITPTHPLRVCFELKGAFVSEAEIVSMGAGGFGAWVADRFAGLFEPGARLIALTFDDLDLPEPPPLAKVVFSTLKGQSARPGLLMIGVEYPEPSEAFQRIVDAQAEA